MGVRPQRQGNTFATFQLDRNSAMAAALNRCRAVAEGREWCAFLHGSTGNGKTHLAVAALHERGAGQFWKAPEFLAWLRQLLSKGIEAGYGSEQVEMVLEEYHRPFLLVLDDLGTENQTDWAAEQLYRLLDERYEERAPTIITSNVAFEHVDARIRSRFREGYVACAGRDLRGAP